MSLLMLLACNSYETFRVTGYEQANFSNDADILFVIDNSSSMTDEAEALALNFETFIARLTSSTEGSNVPHATLTDAVKNYLRETSGDSLFIDYQLALTTSSVDWSSGLTTDIEPGEAGTLTGDVIRRNSEDPAGEFREQLVCKATCWSTVDMPSDPEFDCDDEVGDQVTIEYLDCVCGVDRWQGHCGSGQEMGIEAAYMAMCRAAEDPPEECYNFDYEGAPVAFGASDVGSNADLLRENANTIVVVVTDEGDASPRKEGIGDADVEPYLDAFSEFVNPVRFAVIGPYYENGEVLCNSGGAQPWAVERYQNIADQTLGVYVNIVGDVETCEPSDFAENLSQIGDLLSNLLTLFPLQSIPDASTIRVWIDGTELGRSPVEEGSEADGTVIYGDGWSYDAAYNAVSFNCSPGVDEGDDADGNCAAVPDYNSDVRIYYRPLGGVPRELPF